MQSLYQRGLKSPAPQEEELEHSIWSGKRKSARIQEKIFGSERKGREQETKIPGT